MYLKLQMKINRRLDCD